MSFGKSLEGHTLFKHPAFEAITAVSCHSGSAELLVISGPAMVLQDDINLSHSIRSKATSKRPMATSGDRHRLDVIHTTSYWPAGESDLDPDPLIRHCRRAHERPANSPYTLRITISLRVDALR